MVSFFESFNEPVESLWRQLMTLDVVREQQAAFTCATGLPLAFLPARSSAPGSGGSDSARAVFCIQGCLGGQSGVVCQRVFQNAERRAAGGAAPVQYRCPTGLIKIIAPVLVRGRHVGNVVAGPFSLQKLDEATFRRIRRRLESIGHPMHADRLRIAWRFSPVITSERGRALALMVNMFAQYLSECGGRLLKEAAALRSPLLQKIEGVLREMQDRSISVRELAERVSLSPCHFCKVFKKQTGLTFTEYRARLRIERAQTLLENPHVRISEAAFEAGFDSIQYFNRVFRRMVGCSPSEYRGRRSAEIEAKKTPIQA
jgi:AraC-like DNA-binding protein